jgi:hypothetical protein
MALRQLGRHGVFRRPLSVLWPRWVFLRLLGLVFLSAFYSLAFQIHGLLGPEGILPAAQYLPLVARAMPGLLRFWYAPTVLWLGSGNGMLTAIVTAGAVASVMLTFNVWPRLSLGIAWLAFLSFIAAAQDFASYQSDGMLLEAGFISLFFAPPGLRPGLGATHPPSRLSLFLLQWEWFRIYFESGVVKLASGDVSWRDFTAMDHYYENGPLPTWLGWYVQHWGHSFHAATVLVTLGMELVVCWLAFFPRRYRLVCCFLCTVLQVGIIATANYAFLNYLVLFLGVLLLDDPAFAWVRARFAKGPARGGDTSSDDVEGEPSSSSLEVPIAPFEKRAARAAESFALGLVLYATLAVFLFSGAPPAFRWLLWPARAIEPFRIANRYGLFAVMTPARYEIEFQGSNDGRSWTAYPFRYKPQDPLVAPGIYAPYQPRFEWNLWFASLGSWRSYPWVVRTEARLLEASPEVLTLFARNPFPKPPKFVRAIQWQYWFTDPATKRSTGAWWRREALGLYCPLLTRDETGRIQMIQEPQPDPDPQSEPDPQ